MAKKKPAVDADDHLKTFEHWGVVFKNRDDKDVEKKGNCPFCGGSALFVNRDEGFFHCKTCDKQGNKYTFIQLYYDMWFEKTTTKKLKPLVENRGLPLEAFQMAEIAWDANLKVWLLPSRNTKGSMVNLYRWNPEKQTDPETGKQYSSPVIGTAGLKVHLGNLDRIGKSQIINHMEGPWDCYAMEYLLYKADIKDQAVTWVPGATTFKDGWEEEYDGKDVHLFYDNDSAGVSGDKKVVDRLHQRGKCRSIKHIVWPDSYPDKFDARDFISKNIGKPKKCYKDFIGLLEPISGKKKKVTTDVKKTFEEVLEVFRERIYLSKDMEEALLLIFATVVSNIISEDPYCPVWLFITGPSGGGKTLLLQTVSGLDSVITRDKITANNMVSLYKTPDGSDPSLLPELIGNTFLVKDWTVIMRLPPSDQEQIHSVMRAVFDGRYEASSGVGIIRQYPEEGSEHETCHFTFLAGVTNDIYLEKENRSSVGERSLKFQLIQDQKDMVKHLLAASKNTIENRAPEIDLRECAEGFLEYKLSGKTYLPKVTPEMEMKILGLAQFACIIGANVHRKQGELLLRPSPTVASRMLKQLIKEGQAISFLLDEPEVSERAYRTLQRVALDTYCGWNRDAILAVAEMGEEGALREDVMRLGRMSSTTAQRALENLFELGAITSEDDKKNKVSNRPPKRWFLSEPTQVLWDLAEIDLSILHQRPVLNRKKRGRHAHEPEKPIVKSKKPLPKKRVFKKPTRATSLPRKKRVAKRKATR